jgi:DNA-binding transcriptional MerR regulator
MHSKLYNGCVTDNATSKEFLRAGELAKAAGVSTDTLRHYERKGVLAAPRRSPNGYREYPAEALERVRLVRRALAIGFTLDELARILKVRDRGGAPCSEVRALAAERLSDVETRLSELTSLRDELHLILKDWDSRLAGRAGGERASLLEALVANGSSNGKEHSPPVSTWRQRKKKGL